MNIESLITQRLPRHLAALDVLQRTVDQVNKDAGVRWVAFRPNRADEATLREIASAITEGARALLNADRGRLQQVVYRFDLPEAHVALVFQEPDLETRVNLFAQLLFERALSKVLIRLAYS